jgi:protein TilB
MVLITEKELKKRAEHNYGRLHDLEEVSLHQLHIPRIENLDKLCRGLKILYLQDNAITKIENLHRLKCLQYVNLAMNAIEMVEGLAGCETLRKLDLTLNFIGALSSVRSLTSNERLEELYLTGNPCSAFPGYREWVVAALPRLHQLDGAAVESSERIVALQDRTLQERVAGEEARHAERRRREREEHEGASRARREQAGGEEEGDAVERRKRFFDEKSSYCPETKLETQAVMEEMAAEKEAARREDRTEAKEPRRLFMADGRPFNINEARIPFSLSDSATDALEVMVEVHSHLETAAIHYETKHYTLNTILSTLNTVYSIHSTL